MVPPGILPRTYRRELGADQCLEPTVTVAREYAMVREVGAWEDDGGAYAPSHFLRGLNESIPTIFTKKLVGSQSQRPLPVFGEVCGAEHDLRCIFQRFNLLRRGEDVKSAFLREFNVEDD